MSSGQTEAPNQGQKADGTFYFTQKTPEKVWDEVEESMESSKTKPVVKDKGSGWKIIRIFVSSTFKDFFYEREILVKKVFAMLREWCEKRRLMLIDCDLRWGAPEGATDEEKIIQCMAEIERCKEDNELPFFISMVSQRCGWVPNDIAITEDIRTAYNWIFGLSVTEMEIMYGAYRIVNPNAIFMIRDKKSVENLPKNPDQKNYYKTYYDENPEPDKPRQPEDTYERKLKLLKEKLVTQFPKEQVVKYSVSATHVTNPRDGAYELEIHPVFEKTVLDFFKTKIAAQYPEPKYAGNVYLQSAENHKAFMSSKTVKIRQQTMFIGRKELIEEVKATLKSPKTILLVGEAGIGKSSVMARISIEACEHKNEWFGDCKVFYHFVGAVPRSTELLFLLQRLLFELGIEERNIPNKLETAIQECFSELCNTSKRFIVIIDALNQLDESPESENILVNWIPHELPPNVRIICSVIKNTTEKHKVHTLLKERIPHSLKEIVIGPLTEEEKKDLATKFLKGYNKTLEEEQLENLLKNTNSQNPSANPLWLMIALEELRIFGKFRNLKSKISELNSKKDLASLLEYVLERFDEEVEKKGYPIQATLALLEVSRFGLYETELIDLLKIQDIGYSDYKWSVIFSCLKPFLRPYGERSSGRLDFYHRSLSKAVRQRYLRNQNTTSDWHKKLADYFEGSKIIERKLEEYPYHLIALKDKKRMTTFLGDWETVDHLLHKDYSTTLFHYWNFCRGIFSNPMASTYEKSLKMLEKTASPILLAGRYLHVANIFIQEGKTSLIDDGLKLATNVEKMLPKLDNREQIEADVKIFLAKAYHMKLRLKYFTTEKQVRQQEKDAMAGLDSCEQGIVVIDRIIAKEVDTQRKQDKGVLLLKRAQLLCHLKKLRGFSAISAETVIDMANRAADDAIAIFDEIRDSVHVAEGHMTRGLILSGTPNCIDQQIKNFDQALAICKQTCGEYHEMVSRIISNKAIAYEDAAKIDHIESGNIKDKQKSAEKLKSAKRYYQKAYTEYKRNHEIAVQVFGVNHSRSKRNAELYESEYVYKYKFWEK